MSSSHWSDPMKWFGPGSSSVSLEQSEDIVTPVFFSVIPFNVSKIADSLEESWIIEVAEPYFAILGKEVRESYMQTRGKWIELALGYGTKEKVFAIFLGYCMIGLMVAVYLNVLTVGNMRSAGRAVRGAVKQQLVVFKVSIFLLYHYPRQLLINFPGCLVYLDRARDLPFCLWDHA
jgi:E3 ubiquitin-protein ligase MARCH6